MSGKPGKHHSRFRDLHQELKERSVVGQDILVLLEGRRIDHIEMAEVVRGNLDQSDLLHDFDHGLLAALERIRQDLVHKRVQHQTRIPGDLAHVLDLEYKLQ